MLQDCDVYAGLHTSRLKISVAVAEAERNGGAYAGDLRGMPAGDLERPPECMPERERRDFSIDSDGRAGKLYRP